MKKFKIFIMLLIFTILLGGCAKQETEPKPGSTPLLLEVTKDGRENKLYLFGSIHAAEETMYPLPAYVTEAYNKSDFLAVEFDLIEFMDDISNQLALLSKFVYKDDKTIKDVIKEETYEKSVEILSNTNLYNFLMDRYKPMMWYSMIESATMADTELSEEYGIDNHFLTLAKEDNKKILELESAEYQYEMLIGFDDKTQIYLLEYSVENFKKSKENLKQLYELYKKGNQTDLEELLFKEEEESNKYLEEYNNKLITIRNKNMTKALEDAFKDGQNIFCTVGLAHIIGEDGIASQLKEKGYTITTLQ